jgi:hypothetical protein
LSAHIGRLTDVVRVRTGGINLHRAIEAGASDHLAEHALRGRRPADVSHTYE